MAKKKSLDSYRKEALSEAAAQQAAYEKRRRQQAEQAYTAQKASISNAAKSTTATYRKQIGQADKAYQAMYDTNAVNELISRRQVAETMANLGLTDSGMNQTQQTALSLTKANADTKVSTQKQAYVDQLNLLISETLEKAKSDTLSAKAAILQDANADMEAYRQKTLTSAESRAESAHDKAFSAYTSYYKSFAEQGISEKTAQNYALALAYGSAREIATQQAIFSREQKKLQAAKKQEEKEKILATAKQKKTVKEKREEYASLLIRNGYYVEEAWTEAYLAYPRSQEEKE